MRVLVTGAGGFVGRHLLPVLANAGTEILVLDRTGNAPFPNAVRGPADFEAIGAWGGWPDRLDAVVHLAALNPRRGTPGWGDAAALDRVNAAGTGALAARGAREGVPRFVFVSTAKVHGPATKGPARADDPLSPPDPYARSKARGEAALRDAVRGTLTTGIVLRPVPVHGAGGGGLVAGLARLARASLPLPLLDIGAPRALLAVESLAAAVAAALLVDRSAFVAAGEPPLLLADGGPLTPAEIIAALREGWGRAPALFAAPLGLGRLAGAAAARLGAGTLLRPFTVDASPADVLLGWRPAASSADALRGQARAGAFGPAAPFAG